MYRNDGGGGFAAVEAGLPGLGRRSTGAWGDFDNDGTPDILLTGYPFTAKVFVNSGGRFYETRIALPQLAYGTAAWGDYDGDGRLDILLSGWSLTDGARKPWSGIYRNDSEFTDVGATGVPAGSGTLAWGDYDGDGRLDLAAAGDLLDAGSASAGIYHNDMPTANSPPSAPGTPGATVDAGQVWLSWTAAADGETPAAGLTYNVRVEGAPAPRT